MHFERRLPSMIIVRVVTIENPDSITIIMFIFMNLKSTELSSNYLPSKLIKSCSVYVFNLVITTVYTTEPSSPLARGRSHVFTARTYSPIKDHVLQGSGTSEPVFLPRRVIASIVRHPSLTSFPLDLTPFFTSSFVPHLR